MIKIRNKRIAMLLVLAMLVTMFASVGTASAISNYVDVNGTWEYVDADATGTAGDIVIQSRTGALEWAKIDQNVTELYATITLPDGVTFDTDSTFDATAGTVAGTADQDNNSILITGSNFADASTLNWLITDNIIAVDADVTGSIAAEVRVWAVDGTGAVIFDETENQVIAKIESGDVTVTAAKAKTVLVGDEETAAKITVKEGSPSAFGDGDDPYQEIKYTILTSGVEWDRNADDVDQFSNTFIDEDYFLFNAYRDTDKVLIAEFYDDPSELSKVVLTPLLTIQPGVTGDISIKVSGDNIDTQTFVVAKVGTTGVDVTVTDPDVDFIYRGQAATFDDVTVKLNPGVDWDNEEWFSITLPTGLKFQEGGQPIATNVDGDDTIRFQDVYNHGKSAWFTVTPAGDNLETTIKLTDFELVADYNAVVGDVAITFGGNVEGSYKIGSIKNAFTVATTPFQVQSGLTTVKAADIVITETADGALRATDGNKYYGADNGDGPSGWVEVYIPDYGYELGAIYLNDYYQDDYLDIKLPSGVTFASTPDVEVTTGDLGLGDVSVVDDNKLRIEIDDASNIQSTITVSNLTYSVLNQPALGDITAKVGAEYNVASANPLEALTIGAIATNPTAVYVIGAPTFTVNGAVNNVVAPSYVKNDRTYLAIRDITTGLGIDPTNVMWDEANQRVTMIKGSKIVQVTIGSSTMYVNGVAIAMDVAPEMGPTFRSMLPAAFIAQAFGATASWDGLTSTVTIK